MTAVTKARLAHCAFGVAQVLQYAVLVALMQWPWWAGALLVGAATCGHVEYDLKKLLEKIEKIESGEGQ